MIDALIASSIITLSLIIIFTTHSIRPESNPTIRLAEDYTNYLISTKIREFQGGSVQNYIAQGNITNLDNTLMEQLIEFYYQNTSGLKDTSEAMSTFTNDVSTGVIPAQRNFALYINDSLIHTMGNKAIENSELVISTKKIGFKRINSSFIYGPVILEVKIWV
ncbi:MAG: hypothetical protein KKF46_06530 [Nanoarchaeota archaeon]|nr:hypothetical protein [Nanoarchaeota archaeon]